MSTKLTEAQRDEVCARYLDGEKSPKLGQSYGVSPDTILNVLRSRDIRRTGSDYALSDDQVRDACLRYQNGQASAGIGREYGVAKKTILNALERCGINRRDRSASKIRHTVNHDAFSTPLTTEAQYWVGFCMGNSSIEWGKATPVVQMTLSAVDADHIFKFRNFVGSSHKVRHTPSTVRGFPGAKPQCAFAFSSRGIAEALAELGMGKGLKPDRLACPELTASRDFWRGAIDADGCLSVDTRGSRPYATLQLVGWKPLMEQFVGFVKSVYPPYNGSVRPSRSIHVVQLSATTAYRVIEALYTNAEVNLDRKNATAQSILSDHSMLGAR